MKQQPCFEVNFNSNLDPKFKKSYRCSRRLKDCIECRFHEKKKRKTKEVKNFEIFHRNFKKKNRLENKKKCRKILYQRIYI